MYDLPGSIGSEAGCVATERKTIDASTAATPTLGMPRLVQCAISARRITLPALGTTTASERALLTSLSA